MHFCREMASAHTQYVYIYMCVYSVFQFLYKSIILIGDNPDKYFNLKLQTPENVGILSSEMNYILGWGSHNNDSPCKIDVSARGILPQHPNHLQDGFTTVTKDFRICWLASSVGHPTVSSCFSIFYIHEYEQASQVVRIASNCSFLVYLGAFITINWWLI